jgi:hypothetical protein
VRHRSPTQTNGEGFGRADERREYGFDAVSSESLAEPVGESKQLGHTTMPWLCDKLAHVAVLIANRLGRLSAAGSGPPQQNTTVRGPRVRSHRTEVLQCIVTHRSPARSLPCILSIRC